MNMGTTVLFSPLTVFDFLRDGGIPAVLYLFFVIGPLIIGAVCIVYKIISIIYSDLLNLPSLYWVFNFKARRHDRLYRKISKFTSGRYELALKYYCKERYGSVGDYPLHGLDNAQLKELLSIPENEWLDREAYEEKAEMRAKESYEIIKQRYPSGLRLYLNREKAKPSIRDIVVVPIETFDALEKSSILYQGRQKAINDLWALSIQDSKIARKYLKSEYSSFDYPDIDEYGEDCITTLRFAHGYLYGYCYADNLEYDYLPEFKEAKDFLNSCIEGKDSIDDFARQGIIDYISEIKPEFVYLSQDDSKYETINTVSFHFGRIKEQLTEKGIPFISDGIVQPVSKGFGSPIVILELASSPRSIKDNLDKLSKCIDIRSTRIVYVSFFLNFSREETAGRINLNKLQQQYLKEVEENEKKRIKEELQKQFEDGLEASVAEEFERRKKGLNIIDAKEYSRLESLSGLLKPDMHDIKQYLQQNGIKYFYHFTDRSNLDSIKKFGGLFSWKYCQEKGIIISKPGGDELSRSLDSVHDLEDYVRCSFCKDLPMRHTLSQKGYNLALLRIKVDVALIEGTLFSDMNATDSDHHHGGRLQDLKRVDLNATRETYVSRESELFKYHQAEVLVKTYIPIKYIDFPTALGFYK